GISSCRRFTASRSRPPSIRQRNCSGLIDIGPDAHLQFSFDQIPHAFFFRLQLRIRMSVPSVAKPRRTHLRSPLMRESLLDKRVISTTATETELSILPDVNVIALGGQSILDRGKRALVPVLDQIVKARRKHKIIIGVGGGARVRHTFHICLDLGIPLGGLAMVAGAVDEQNTRLVSAILAKHKGIALN